MTTSTETAAAIDAADAPRLRRELADEIARGDRLRVAAQRAADDMDRAAAQIRSIYVDRGVSESLIDHAEELRREIARSEA